MAPAVASGCERLKYQTATTMTRARATSTAMPLAKKDNNPRKLGIRPAAGSNSGVAARLRRRLGQLLPSEAKETKRLAVAPTAPPDSAFHLSRAMRNMGNNSARCGFAIQAEKAKPAQKSRPPRSSLIPSATKNRKRIES